jgi:PAS domain S-box-containing protein
VALAGGPEKYSPCPLRDRWNRGILENLPPDPGDPQGKLEEARERMGTIRAGIREPSSPPTAVGKRFADPVRFRMDGRQRQQRRLGAQHAVSRLVEDLGHLSETAPEIFRVLEERFGWEVGVLWTVEEDALRCGGIWRAAGRASNAFEEACRGSDFRRGAGLPGRVWLLGEACWVEDVLEDEDFLRGEAAAAEGLRCVLALPIQNGGRLVGVFELFKGEVSSAEDLLRAAYLSGIQIGQSVGRRRAERERDRALAREGKARQQATDVRESINDAFFAVDREWRFTYVNRQAERFWDRSREGLLGKNVWEEFPWAVGTEAHRAILSAVETGETVEYEAFSPVIGTWISGRAYPSSGGVSVYFHDVSKRKEVEREREELRREAEVGRAGLEGILQQMPGGVFIADHSGRIFLANEGAARIYGREIRSVEESGRYSLSYPDREPIPEEYHPLARALAGGTISLESCVERPDGSFRVISSNAAPVLDAGGRVVAAVNVFQDVTELREARRVIEERERRYRTLTSNIPGAVFRCVLRDGRPTMEFVSGRIEEITGRPARDFVADRALSYADVIHPEDRPKNEREVRRAIEERATYNIEYRLLHANGGVRWVNERGSSIFSKEGGLLWVDGAIFDITERKRSEEALRKSAQRAAFRAELTEALRTLADPAEIKAAAARVLGQHIKANRVIYGEISPDDRSYVSDSEYLDGVVSIAGRLDLDDYDPALLEHFRVGRAVVVPDLLDDPALTADGLAAFEAAQIRAHVSVPLVKDGRLVAALGVNQARPRAWTAEEIALVEETAERTWAAVERARAEEALRRSEERYRTLFEKIDEGFCIIDVVFDKANRPTDYRFLETNPAFERMTGLERAAGRTARELVPDLEDWWFETYGRVALTGEAVHFENGSEAMGRWFEVRTSRIGGGESRKVALVFDDITDRKRAAEERDRMLAREWVAVAEAAERERISRELHDRVAHSMAVAHQSLQLHDVLAGKDARRAEAKLDLAREMIKASLESTRNLSAELRRVDAEDGLEAELRHLLDVSVPPGIRAGIRVSGDEADVPGHVRGQLFLVLREAVRNAVSHSGCGSLSVGLDITPESVVGSVEDDGRGFDPADGDGGVGLRSMRERAALLDGALRLDCGPGRGTRVEVSVPLAGGR